MRNGYLIERLGPLEHLRLELGEGSSIHVTISWIEEGTRTRVQVTALDGRRPGRGSAVLSISLFGL